MRGSRMARSAAIGAAALSALTVVGARASAQPVAQSPTTIEELTITGRVRSDTLSYRVGYGDLDLRTATGRRELNKRIDIAARYVCRKLNSDMTGVDSCQTQATNDVRPQVRAAIHAAQVSTAAWTPGPGWTPPPEK